MTRYGLDKTASVRRLQHHLVLLIALPLWASGCAGLNLQLHRASVQKPSNVALYFSVETNEGAPVGGQPADQFRIFEDDRLISPFESKQTILNPEVAVVHYTLLLIDLSGSVTESGSLETLIAAAASFVEKVSKNQQVAIYGFDGSADLIPLAGFTSQSAGVRSGLVRIATHKSRDPSTNLNGAVVAATEVLEKKMNSAEQPLRFGTLVVFTDGTDRAHRITEDEMYDKLDNADINLFAIGVGGEILPDQLARLGRSGFYLAEQRDQVTTAFDAIAEMIQSASRKFYLLSYCSPSRAGQHQLRIDLSFENKSGSLEHDFDATGFGPHCDPMRSPQFRAQRILLRQKKK